MSACLCRRRTPGRSGPCWLCLATAAMIFGGLMVVFVAQFKVAAWLGAGCHP